MIDLQVFRGRVTCITGHEKNCGKTQFMNFLTHELTQSGCGLAVMTAGYDGEARDLLSGTKKPLIWVVPGTIVVTPERFLKTSLIFPEILEVVPGSTSLGACCIARAQRAGTITLASGEGNSSLRWTLDYLTANKLAETILVDGAFNRITQAGAWPDAQLVYVLRVDAITLKKNIETLERLLLLLALECASIHEESIWELNDVLSLETLKHIPPHTRTVVIQDFTHVFLPLKELKALLSDKRLLVKRRIPCAGIPVIVRGLSFNDFYAALPGVPLKQLIFQNPYEQGDLYAR